MSLVGDWNSTTTVLGGQQATENRTHDDVHQVTGIGGLPTTHDAKGNFVRQSGAVDTFVYDFDNRLRAADMDQDGTPEVLYTYDALGRRVSKTAPVPTGGSTTVVFVSSGQRVVAEYSAGSAPSSPIHKYLWGSYVDEPLMLVSVTGSGPGAAESSYYYHTNRLYCVAGLTDANGNVVERYAYSPYGKQPILSPAGAVLANSAIYQTRNVVGHQGLFHDQETGLIYNRARMLDPVLGRFVQRDPLGYIDGYSMYPYYAGMWGTVDPEGMELSSHLIIGDPIPLQTVMSGKGNTRFGHMRPDGTEFDISTVKEKTWELPCLCDGDPLFVSMTVLRFERTGSLEVKVNPVVVSPWAMEIANDGPRLEKAVKRFNESTLDEEVRHAKIYKTMRFDFEVPGFGASCNEAEAGHLAWKRALDAGSGIAKLQHHVNQAAQDLVEAYLHDPLQRRQLQEIDDAFFSLP